MGARGQQGGKLFTFEAGWLEEDDCEKVIKESWELAMLQGDVGVQEALRRVAGVGRGVLTILELECSERFEKASEKIEEGFEALLEVGDFP